MITLIKRLTALITILYNRLGTGGVISGTEIATAIFTVAVFSTLTGVVSTAKRGMIAILTGLMSARESCVISCAEIATTSCASGMVFALTSIVSTAKRGMVAAGASVMSAT